MCKSINAWDIKVSILFNLLLAIITILLCFFFFFIVTFKKTFIIPVVKENTRVKLALAILAGIPITLVKKIILIPPLAADKISLVNIIKSNNVFTYFFTHCLSFLNF